jgi:hypothetical protein
MSLVVGRSDGCGGGGGHERIDVRLLGVHDAADYSVLWVVIVTSA